jgi:hypothetical protein
MYMLQQLGKEPGQRVAKADQATSMSIPTDEIISTWWKDRTKTLFGRGGPLQACCNTAVMASLSSAFIYMSAPKMNNVGWGKKVSVEVTEYENSRRAHA